MTAIFDGADRFEQSVTFGTDIGQATLDTDGVWMSIWVYVASAPSASTGLFHAGTGSFTNIFGLITNASGNPRAYFTRGGGADEVVAANALQAGWNLVTCWIREGTTAGRVSLSIWHNGYTVAENLNEVKPSLVMDLHDTLYAGSIGTGNYLTGELAGAGFGTGDPASAHSYAWNSGTAREIDGYNFAGDANSTLDYYAPWGKEGTDTVDTGDTELLDTVGSLDTWTFGGAPVWSTRAAPFNGGETGTLGTPALTDATSLGVTVTLPSNNWGTITIDDTKVKVWATRGYGNVSVSSGSASGGSTAATVDITLGRSVYSDETVIVTFEEGWMVDDAGNSALSAEDVSVTVTSGAANGATTTHAGASYLKMAVDLSAARLISFTREGFPGIDCSGGAVNVTATYPVEQGTTPNQYDGAQKNPLGNDLQGFDERDSNTYSSGLRLTYPTSFDANDSLIKQIGRPTPTATPASTSIFTAYQGYGAFYFINGTFGSGDFAPPAVGFDGTSARPVASLTEAQLDAIVADVQARAGLDTSSLQNSAAESVTKPPAADLLYRIAQLNLGRTLSTSGAAYYRRLVPLRWTAQDGYHRYNQETLGTIVTALCADYTAEELKPLVMWIIHHGLQWYEAQLENENGPIRGGNQGHYAPTALALLWLGRGGEIDDIRTVCGGKEYQTTYKTIQADLDGLANHTVDTSAIVGDNRRITYKEKEVTGVSGADITCANMGVAESEPEYDDMIITDGVTDWGLVSYDDGTKTFTLDTAAHGLSVSDTIWAKWPYTPSLGDADWGRFHNAGDGTENLPSRSGPSSSWRRDFERYGGAWFALQALGCRTLVNHDAFFEYVERQNAGNQPTVGLPFPNSWDVWYGDVTSDAGAVVDRGVDFVEAMILEHGDTIASAEQYDSPPPIPGTSSSSRRGLPDRSNIRYGLRYNIRRTA